MPHVFVGDVRCPVLTASKVGGGSIRLPLLLHARALPPQLCPPVYVENTRVSLSSWRSRARPATAPDDSERKELY